MELAKQSRAISWLAAALILALFLWVRVTRSDFDRPFEWDELTTLRYFTWAGVEPSGEPRPLDHIEDIRRLGSPSLREFGIGVYCSLGRWPEPGNHVVHSLLANFPLALFQPGEASLRLAALAGALVFGVALYWLVTETFRWRFAAPLVLILALWNPFVWRYSATARGYTWLFALQLLLLILLLRLPRNPFAIGGTLMAVATACLSVMNHLTMAGYWVLPVYSAFWILTPDERGRSGSLTPKERRVWRRNLTAQALIVAGVVGLFIVDRLPYIYASSGAVSIDAGDGGQSLTDFAGRIGATLFPGLLWKLVAVAGLLGLVLAPRGSARRTLLAVASIGGVVGLAQLAFSGENPPPRVLAWVVPVCLLGLAGLVEGLVRRLPAWRRRVALSLAAAAVGVALVGIGFKGLPASSPVEELIQSFRETIQAEAANTLMLADKRVGPVVPLYLPRSWRGVQQPPPEGVNHLVMLVRPTDLYGRGLATRNQRHEVDPWEPLAWPGTVDREVGDTYRLLESTGRVVRFPLAESPSRALVFWYPGVESVAVRPQRVLQHLEDFPVRYMAIKVPFPAKLEVFFRLGCLVFPADSSSELDAIEGAVGSGLERFGGGVRVFIPDDSRP